MHRYLRSIGFSMYKKKTEIKELMDKIQNENITSAKIIITPEKERLWEIRKDLAEDFGICIYGYLENLGAFIREGFYPYIKTEKCSTSSDCIIQKHFDDELFLGMIDDYRMGITLIFRLANPFEYLDNPYEPNIHFTSLFGFCDDGKVLLPVYRHPDTENAITTLRRDFMSLAAMSGDEEAIEALSLDDLVTWSSINQRIQTEDLYSIISTLFMPYGMEADMYSIIGNILEVKIEENIITGEKVFILEIISNGIQLYVAVQSDNLQGEPVPGRRFKGNVWVLGNIHNKSTCRIFDST